MKTYNSLSRKSIFNFLMILVLVAAFGVACDTDDDDDDDNGGSGTLGDDDDDDGGITPGDDDDDGDNDDDDVEPDELWVRAIHLSPDAPGVDVWVNGTIPAFENLEFKESSQYATLEPGTYSFQITAHMGDVKDAVLEINDLALEKDTYYTAVAFNLLGAPIEALALVDDYSTVPQGKMRVRAIHTAAGIGQVDIWVVPDSADPFPLFEDVDFRAVSPYVELDTMEYTLGFDLNDDAIPDAFFDIPELPSGTVANIFALKDGDAVFLGAQLADGTVAIIDAYTIS